MEKGAKDPLDIADILKVLPGDIGRMAEVAGLEAAISIARAFRGTYLYVPSLDGLLKEARDETIRRDYGRGRAVRKIAMKFSLTERTVRKILGRPSSGLAMQGELLYEMLNKAAKAAPAEPEAG